MALGAVRAAREAGLHVPEDVSVIGFDDSRLIQFLDPPLTTIRQPAQAIGSAAVAALADAIDGEPIPAHEYLYKPELVLRGSTAPAPVPSPS
jgi:alanine racemase